MSSYIFLVISLLSITICPSIQSNHSINTPVASSTVKTVKIPTGLSYQYGNRFQWTVPKEKMEKNKGIDVFFDIKLPLFTLYIYVDTCEDGWRKNCTCLVSLERSKMHQRSQRVQLIFHEYQPPYANEVKMGEEELEKLRFDNVEDLNYFTKTVFHKPPANITIDFDHFHFYLSSHHLLFLSHPFTHKNKENNPFVCFHQFNNSNAMKLLMLSSEAGDHEQFFGVNLLDNTTVQYLDILRGNSLTVDSDSFKSISEILKMVALGHTVLIAVLILVLTIAFACVYNKIKKKKKDKHTHDKAVYDLKPLLDLVEKTAKREGKITNSKEQLPPMHKSMPYARMQAKNVAKKKSQY